MTDFKKIGKTNLIEKVNINSIIPLLHQSKKQKQVFSIQLNINLFHIQLNNLLILYKK